MALVGFSIVLGGGGTANPQTEMALQFLTALVMIPLVFSDRWQRGLGPVSPAAFALAGLILLLPILQLLPLPPWIWHALPGREVEVQSLALVQAEQSWMPLTMAPSRTFASLLAMICPVLIMLQVSRISLRGRSWICTTIVLLGALSILLGVLQLSHTGGLDWSLYSEFHKGFLVGFQANRNAEADVLLAALLALGVLVSQRLADGQRHLITWCGLVLGLIVLAVGIFMTGSRTGIALFVLSIFFLFAMLWPALRKHARATRWLMTGLVTSGLLVVLGLQLPSVQKVIARFSITREARWDLWLDTWYAIQQVWPYGSGMGTIVPMLEAAERLEVVDASRPVRAHNDWLELTLEGGMPGLVVLGVIIAALLALIVRALVLANRREFGAGHRAQVIFAIGLLAIEALHSIVDYPMRSMSLAVLTAVAVAFLLEPAAAQRKQS